MMKKTTLTLGALFLAANALLAKIEMPKIFSENMVLQRGEKVKVWGKSLPNAKIEVEVAGNKSSTSSDSNGSWNLYLGSMNATKIPVAMKVYENGSLDKTITNVVVGEVWVSGGQSNMQWEVSKVNGLEEAKQRADYPQMRFFRQPYADASLEKRFDSAPEAKWIVISPENVGNVSAVSFFFIEQIMKKTNVPVGIVETSLGGTRMTCWLSRDDQKGIPGYEKYILERDNVMKNFDLEKEMAVWKKKYEDYSARKKAAEAAKTPFKEYAPKQPNQFGGSIAISMVPECLYNAKVAPIAGYTAKGFIWYQGESDARIETEGEFAQMFEQLITSWRNYWGKPKMPFLFAQLTSFGTDSNWPLARWEQYLVSEKMDDVEMAVIIDLGEEKDIHPKNKLDVGKRLATIAFDEVYDYNNQFAFGPKFDDVDYSGNYAIVEIDDEDRGIVISGALRGFEVLVNGAWQEASVEKISKDELKVSAKNTGDTVLGVRYLWKNWAQPDVCIFNMDGLPAMPFRNLKK